MPITYPVDVDNTKWSILEVDSGEIIGRNKSWPNLSGTPQEGADANYVYLLQGETAKPDYDSRTHTRITTEVVDAEANTITKSYSTEKRPLEDINASVANEERNALEGVSPYDERDKLVLLGLAVLFRQIEGQTLNAKEQVIADKVVSQGTKLWKNDALLKAKIQDLADGNEPDLSEGWEKE